MRLALILSILKLGVTAYFYDHALPAVLGCDGAGVVVETGSKVSQFKAGDKVWFCHGGLGREQGNYAEYTVIDERWVSLMPETFSFTEAAAVPLVLITAWALCLIEAVCRQGKPCLFMPVQGVSGMWRYNWQS